MSERDEYVVTQFPNGAVYSLRQSNSGIVLDELGAPIDAELAHCMIQIKLHKFCLMPVSGRVC